MCAKFDASKLMHLLKYDSINRVYISSTETSCSRACCQDMAYTVGCPEKYSEGGTDNRNIQCIRYDIFGAA